MSETRTSHSPEADAQSSAEAFAPAEPAGQLAHAREQAKTKAPDLQLKQRPRRTTGLWLTDALIFGTNNVLVFAISILATYYTKVGNKPKLDGSQRNWFARSMAKRGDELKKHIFEPIGIRGDAADNAKMVFFSWFDGTLIAPFIKLLEDRRGKIAHAIDRGLGNDSVDESVYAHEPKQTWSSLLLGRLATALVVVPTAVVLEKKGKNEEWFYEKGHDTGNWVQKKPGLKKLFSKNTDFDELFRVVWFEAFYTTVCTVGLYFSSRAIALFQGKRRDAQEAAIADAAAAASPPVTAQPVARAATQEAPSGRSVPPSTQQGGWRGSAARREREPKPERAETVAGRLEQRDLAAPETALVH